MTDKQLHLDVTGMHCEACVRRLKMALEKLPGMQVQSVEVGSANVTYDPQQLNPERISEAVEKIGFKSSVAA